MDATSRRGFLKLAGLGAIGAAIGPRPAGAESKSLTFLHESSFIKTFDEYFQKTLAPAYEKETGVKINYELTSVGSLPTRVTTISETGSGADVTMMFFLLPFLFDEKLLFSSNRSLSSSHSSARAVSMKRSRWLFSWSEGFFMSFPVPAAILVPPLD